MSLPPGFEPHHRFDFFEPNDRTALVCLDVPEMQRLAVEQLDSLGYKIHTDFHRWATGSCASSVKICVHLWKGIEVAAEPPHVFRGLSFRH